MEINNYQKLMSLLDHLMEAYQARENQTLNEIIADALSKDPAFHDLRAEDIIELLLYYSTIGIAMSAGKGLLPLPLG